MSSWSELPRDLIAAISQHLTTVADYARFRAVCSSWRSAAPSAPRHLPLQTPWLAFSDKFLPFPSSAVSHSLPLPLCGPHYFLGSSDGLLALRSPAGFSLFNPLTRSLAPFPSLRTFPMSPFFVKKIVLSPRRPTPSALALLGCSTNLALCCPGDASWTLIHGISTYHDALFFDGSFHIVDGFRRIFVLDGDDCSLTEIARIRVSRTPPFIGKGEKCYLAEWKGDLLLVVRHYKSVSAEGQRVVAVTEGFQVFRLELGGSDEHHATAVELSDLENSLVFLGLNRSIVLPADEHPGLKGNRIYFLDDVLNTIGDLAQKVCDAGVYDMSTRSIEPLHYCIADVASIHGRQPAVWHTPSF